MPFINLTPHAIALRRIDGEILLLDGSPRPARITLVPGECEFNMSRVPVHKGSTFGGVENLPEPQQGVLYIVSQMTALMVAGLHPDRHDLCYPATSIAEGATRDANGVLTVDRLIRAN